MANTLFVPARKVISNITNAVRAVITVTEPHDYISGEYVRIHIAPEHGMIQLAQKYAPIEVIDSVSFYLNIDTRMFEPFVLPVPEYQSCQCVAIGSINELLQGAVHNSLNPFFT